ncbi:STAS domain-containing protein [Listeria floridensis FSL S10-1187]|uniref:STAS domain-containing protein n=1 Tax=Listeria floridensis FSL S10-1187 TaxID=1265817 RepID=A0ABN0RDH4_9LIST|nr:STAS domain-containing protein [Listeria floridensis]EUJ28840.1 STAS domain-containing protein [Listeria floridensis FSL S10-1187]
MYQRRVKNDVPLPEVIMTLDKLRQQVLSAAAVFAIHDDSITKADFSKIIHTANQAFDTIIGQFSTLYYTQIVNFIENQRSLIDEISAPLISITDQIAILPVVGRVDRERAQLLMESAVKRCNELNLNDLCLDLSATTTFDTALAEMLFQLAHITKLLGIELVLSGIKPKMAQEMIRVDMQIEIPAYHSLKAFLKDRL